MRGRAKTPCPGTLLIFAVLLVTSCVNTKPVTYFNDVTENAVLPSPGGLEPVIQPNDLLSITVSSLNPQATQIFNTPNLPASPNGAANPAMLQTAGYLVSNEGWIKFPILGEMKAVGQTKKSLEETITKQLLDKKLLFDPIVNIRYLNFRVTVLGEVARPGVVNVPSEQINILEALGQAGDLTIHGKRENVLLIRQEGDKKRVQRINLNQSGLLQSPFFYLKSNDVLYVEPGKAKVATGSRGQQLLPSVLSGISIAVVIITSLIR